MRYKLLTPGPLTTTDTVKREMMIDHCTWDDDYKSVTQKIRAGLLKLAHVSEEEYTSVLIQGSGTFGVEAAITTLVGEDDYLLILANGAYGERMADIAHHAGISYHMRSWAIDEQPDAQTVKMILQENKSITHVAVSYTHLDVYKRQRLRFLYCAGRVDAMRMNIIGKMALARRSPDGRWSIQAGAVQ